MATRSIAARVFYNMLGTEVMDPRALLMEACLLITSQKSHMLRRYTSNRIGTKIPRNNRVVAGQRVDEVREVEVLVVGMVLLLGKC
jgi:hypothetical protein